MNNTQVITLKASGAEATSATQTAVKFRGIHREAQILLNVTAAATLITDTLDVYIDTSPDGGSTWYNVGHFTQVLGNGGAKKYVMVLNSSNAGTSAVLDVTSDAGAGVTRQYGIADRLRSRSVVSGTGTFTYSVVAFVK